MIRTESPRHCSKIFSRVNLKCGILDNQLICPYISKDRLTDNISLQKDAERTTAPVTVSSLGKTTASIIATGRTASPFGRAEVMYPSHSSPVDWSVVIVYNIHPSHPSISQNIKFLNVVPRANFGVS